MMKFRHVALIGTFFLLLGIFAFNTPQQLLGQNSSVSMTNPWRTVGGYIKTASSTAGLQVEGLASSGDCLVTDATGKISATACSSGSYPDYLSQVGDVSTSTLATGYVLKWSGTAWESVATSTLNIGGGTVNSVDMSVPTGLTISGNPVTTSGTLAVAYTAGYSIPKTASTTEGTTAYLWGNHAGLYLPIGGGFVTGSTTVNSTLTVTGTTTTSILCFASGQCMTQPSISGSNVTMYHWNGASDTAGYEMFRTYPDSAVETDESCSATSGYCASPIDSYISTTTDLSVSSISAGTWNFHYWTYVNSFVGVSKLQADVYRRTSLGVETLLFTATSTEIDNLTVQEVDFSSVQGAFAFTVTDRLVVKVRGWTDSGVAKTIHFIYGGDTRYSHIETPIMTADFNYAVKSANETITGAWTHTATTTFATTTITSASTTQLSVSGMTWLTGLLNATNASTTYTSATRFFGGLTGTASGNLISGGTLTSAYHCRWDGTGVDCDRVEDASGACGANAVCMGGHTHVGVDEAFATGWDADVDPPEKDDVYDWGHVFDWDNDGLVSRLDTTYGVVMSSDAGTTTASSTPYVSSIVASSTSATSSFAGGFGIGSTTPSVQFSMDGRAGSFWRIFNNAKLKIMEIVDSTVTLLGTWDFSGATVKQSFETGFTYASTTAFVATTTVNSPTGFTAQILQNARCYTDVGTVNVSAVDSAGNRMNMFNASTTEGTITYSTNNTLTAGEQWKVEFGTPASSPTKLTCNFKGLVNN